MSKIMEKNEAGDGMRKRTIFFWIVAMTILIVLAASFAMETRKVIKGTDFAKVTILKNKDNEVLFEIKDKITIENIVNQINSSKREKLSKIVFEQGPDGRVIFAGKNGEQEVQVFLDTGKVVTKKHYIHSDLAQYLREAEGL